MDLETLRVIGSLATALGIGTVVQPAAKHIYSRLTGRARAVRSEVDKAWAEVQSARERVTHVERARDREMRLRRKLEEYASRLVRRLTEAPCVDDATIPSFPEYPADTGPLNTKDHA